MAQKCEKPVITPPEDEDVDVDEDDIPQNLRINQSIYGDLPRARQVAPPKEVEEEAPQNSLINQTIYNGIPIIDDLPRARPYKVCSYEQEQEQEENRKKSVDHTNKMISMGLEFFNSIFERQSRIKDPVSRYTVLCDKLATIPDILLAVMKSNYEDNDVSLTTMKELMVARKKFNDEIIKMMDWIASPTYSPDHVIGNSMMKESEDRFKQDAISLKKDEDYIIQQINIAKKLLEERPELISLLESRSLDK